MCNFDLNDERASVPAAEAATILTHMPRHRIALRRWNFESASMQEIRTSPP